MRFVLSVLLMASFFLIGCGDTEPTEAESAPTVEEQSQEPYLENMKIVLPPPSQLEGHSWKAGEITFSFQNGGHALVRGGFLDETMPNGAPARYEMEGSTILIEVLGREYEGVWDGTSLTISGNTAEYMGENKDNTK